MPDNKTPGINGEAVRLRRSLSGGKLGRMLAAHDPEVGQDTQLAGLAARQLSQQQDMPGGWNRFLLAHLRWILVITVVVVAAAAAYAHHQTPKYTSQTQVNVWFSSPDPAALQGPNMVTEKGIVTSGAVLSKAAHSLAIPVSELRNGLAVSVPAGSSIMQIAYSDPVPWVARERAQVISEAYVQYRSPPKPAPRPHQSQSAAVSAASTTTLHATLITPAQLPTSPSSPNYLVDILAGLVVGLGLGVGTAAIRDHLDDRIRGTSDPEDLTGAPVLAVIPAFRPVWPDLASELSVLWNARSIVSEAYRNLRTRVITAAAARTARTLLVTSPSWEKKSMVAANLAIALAQSGRRTILLCADLRWGTAHQLIGVPGDEGLTTLLDRNIALPSVLRSPGIHNLRVIPPGPLPRDPAEVLQRPALRGVLGQLRSHADFVIIDAPPVLATPDTEALANLADMILLVGDARKSTRAHLQATMRELDEAADRLIGYALYNVGRRRWLRRRPAPAITLGPGLDPDAWDRHDMVDGHDGPAARRAAKNISVTAE
jgi:succinoglycan biosynthesis transport protein ExoP